MNGRDRHDGGGNLIFQRSGVHFAQPAELLLALVDIQLGNKIFIAGEHHHHQQTAHQGHIHQRQQGQNHIRLTDAENMRQYVEDLLKKFDRQRNQTERKAKINRRQQPARGVHSIFQKAFHKILSVNINGRHYTATGQRYSNRRPTRERLEAIKKAGARPA